MDFQLEYHLYDVVLEHPLRMWWNRLVVRTLFSLLRRAQWKKALPVINTLIIHYPECTYLCSEQGFHNVCRSCANTCAQTTKCSFSTLEPENIQSASSFENWTAGMRKVFESKRGKSIRSKTRRENFLPLRICFNPASYTYIYAIHMSHSSYAKIASLNDSEVWKESCFLPSVATLIYVPAYGYLHRRINAWMRKRQTRVRFLCTWALSRSIPLAVGQSASFQEHGFAD